MAPNRILVRAVGLALGLCASACATTGTAPPASASDVSAPALCERDESLRAELERQRDEVRVLRGRVALAEAEARDLRSARSLVEQGRTITIGGGTTSDIDWIEPELARDEAWIDDDEESAEPEPSSRRIVLADEPRVEPSRMQPAPPVRVVPPPSPSRPAPVASIPAASPSPAPAASAPADGGAAQYRAALEAVRARHLDEAIRLFDAFLVAHPTHPYADNALYWQGEIHFVAGRLSEARTAYERIVREHPRANKVSDALFRLGVCAERLGETERARAYFRELRTRFPESSAARRVPEEAT